MRTGRYSALQQESTFWRAEMMAIVDLDMLASYRLAGDDYLWNTFATMAGPKVVKALLGGFTQQRNRSVGRRSRLSRGGGA